MGHMKRMSAPALLLLSSFALADQVPGNLEPFTSVCINAGFSEGDTENDAVSSIIADSMYDKLDAAGIAVNDPPCQPKGLLDNKQLNLYFSFDTTESGETYLADLSGWLSKAGPFDSVDVWTVGRFGNLKKGVGQAKALALVDTTMSEFIADWEESHQK